MSDLIYDWNREGRQRASFPTKVMIVDETLRDGLQSPSITHPNILHKVDLLYAMVDLGIEYVDLGLPGAGPRFRDEVAVMAREIGYSGLNILPMAAVRTLVADIAMVVDASQKAGIPIEAAIFVGSSPVRQYVEGWTMAQLCQRVEEAVGFAVRHGLPVTFVTEDTTRARPEDLRALYRTAVEAGAHRICLCDTVGHALPEGVRALTAFIRACLDEMGVQVGIDWHGHRDRGLALANSLAALSAGADRVHACALGVGERSGNTPMEVLLVNLRLLGLIDNDLSQLPAYVQLFSEVTDTPVPYNQPVVGADAFRTSTGVHAAAIAKALGIGDEWLSNAVYSGVPADMVGRWQRIDVGPMSGLHNVRFWLATRGLAASAYCVEEILIAAKRASRVLTDDEVLSIIRWTEPQVLQRERVRLWV